jgi:hypothetical protein
MSHKRWRSVWLGKNTIWGSQNICYYCGQRADSIDHVIPQYVIRMMVSLDDKEITKKMLRRKALKVWACRECNCLASSSLQDSLQDRRDFVKNKLRKRYRRVLELPTWRDDEIEELGYNLQVFVRSSAKWREFVKQRIAY